MMHSKVKENLLASMGFWSEKAKESLEDCPFMPFLDSLNGKKQEVVWEC